jgi:Autophagy protein ATG9
VNALGERNKRFGCAAAAAVLLRVLLVYFFLSAELSHHHSQEVLQHHRRAAQLQGFSQAAAFSARVWAHQTAEELRHVGAVFYDAAASAWHEAKVRHNNNNRTTTSEEQQQRYRYHHPATAPTNSNGSNNNARQPPSSFSNNNNNNHHAYLDEFGIPKDDPLLQHDADYVSFDDDDDQQQQQQREQPNNDFIYLPNFRFRPANEGWASVANLDLYFQSLYSYYYHRGLVPIVSRGVVELVTLFFTLALSVFLFAYVDWQGLAKCTDEHTCQADFVQSYIRKHPFAKFSLWTAMIILYCLIFCLYSVMAFLSFVNTFQEALNAKWVYEERLGISARKLLGGAVDWDRDVVTKLVALQQSGEYRIAIHNNGQDLDALVIANRILRKENFLVALFNRGLLDLTVPYVSSPGDPFFCSSLEVSIRGDTCRGYS